MRLWFVIGSLLLIASTASADLILYAGNGGHPNPDGSPLSINDGWLITIDQNTGAVSSIGHPAGVARLAGFAFLNSEILYGSTVGGNTCVPNCPFPGPPLSPNTSTLVRINPDTGLLISNIGPITAGAGGSAIAISDLSFQPGTGVLYGIQAVDADLSSGPAGNLYRIDTQTGVATLVGDLGPGVHNGSIAFAPNGTLYLASTDVDNSGNFINTQIAIVDEATGKILSSVPAVNFYTSLAFRESDGVLVGGNGDLADIFTIDPKTGEALSKIGNTGLNFVGDLDFRPVPEASVPEPSSVALAGMGLLGISLFSLIRRRT
jgi:hypothetical protein